MLVNHFPFLSFLLVLLPTSTISFQSIAQPQQHGQQHGVRQVGASSSFFQESITSSTARCEMTKNTDYKENSQVTRRSIFKKSVFAVAAAATFLVTAPSSPAQAATRAPLGDLLYTILRVREATEQETRLIKSGKFKDIQRANIKLAVKFILENYRLADTCVAASAYLEGTEKRVAAGQVGQTTVQNLQTFLEYFDSSDVQNLKLGTNSLAGKEQLVLKGLDAARRNLDDFLSYFPISEIDAAKGKLLAENALNVKEFDPELGSILNLKGTATDL